MIVCGPKRVAQGSSRREEWFLDTVVGFSVDNHQKYHKSDSVSGTAGLGVTARVIYAY